MRAGQLPVDEQLAHFRTALHENPTLVEVLARAAAMNLPGWYLVAGCLYQTVWNVVSGQPAQAGILDYDLAYFDDSDLSWEAEDTVIRAGNTVFAGLPAPVQIRNQARVHLWYEPKFGLPCPPHASTEAAIDTFEATVACLGVRLEPGGRWRVYAPFGLSDMFNLVVRPNPVLAPRHVYRAKTARWQRQWPGLIILPWPAPAADCRLRRARVHCRASGQAAGELDRTGLRPRFRSWPQIEPEVHYLVRDRAETRAVVTRMCPEPVEGGAEGDSRPFREHALGLLDDDPAVERLLELGGGAAGPVQLERVARGHPGEPVGHADFSGRPPVPRAVVQVEDTQPDSAEADRNGSHGDHAQGRGGLGELLPFPGAGDEVVDEHRPRGALGVDARASPSLLLDQFQGSRSLALRRHGAHRLTIGQGHARPGQPERIRHCLGQREEVTAVAVVERNAPEVGQRRRPQSRAGQRPAPLAGVGVELRCQGTQFPGGEPAQRETCQRPELLQGTKLVRGRAMRAWKVG